ncbi:MAG TPA: arabinan endo-1,5-alpha-L-arabinosidase [Balneolales bacterium]|nr:arabinan endo-1,5-alpha-L-arabinosidase [Balneolales bacterium]
MEKVRVVLLSAIMIVATIFMVSCNKQQKESQKSIYAPGIKDNYRDIAGIRHYKQWGTHNVHDPSCIKAGDYYYLFSTDAIYHPRGVSMKSDSIHIGNIQVRRSKDLVHWQFMGWAFTHIPDNIVQYIKNVSGGKKPNGIWAPYITKFGDQFRLYYAVSVFGANTSYIGLATSKSPMGPWKQMGSVVKTDTNNVMNAIDPTVAKDPNNGKEWLIYGSYFNGIYCLPLNSATGLAKNPGGHGKLIAKRANGDTQIIEAPEVIYNSKLKKYFLFVSYGPLFTHYNVRVGRADKPDGPYYDFYGHNMARPQNNYPVLTYAYRFRNHPGWAGVGHCGVLDDNGQYFMFHQGRLAPGNEMMDLHVRKIFWTPSGWPVVSPERYDAIPQTPITQNDIKGKWEQINLHTIKDTVKLWQGQIPPGGWHYDTTEFDNSIIKNYLSSGMIDGNPQETWKLDGKHLEIINSEKEDTTILTVSNGWDWENNRKTIVYTGLGSNGFSIWGKKVELE